MSRTLILVALLALAPGAPAPADDLVGSWAAVSMAVSSGTAETVDVIAAGGALFATFDPEGRYVLTTREPGAPELDPEAGRWTRLSDTELVIRPDGADEGMVVLFTVAADRLTLTGAIAADLNGDGVEDAGHFEAELVRESDQTADGSGLPGAWVRAGGRIRTYRLQRPATSAAPLPLAIVLHGAGGDGAGIRAVSGLDAVAASAGFAVAYPDAVAGEWAAGCDCSAADASGIDDVRLGELLIDQLAAAGWVDPERVAVAGFSLGALMSQRFACERADRVLGVVAVAGGMPPAVSLTCAPGRPLSVTLLHGTADRVVPFEGNAVSLAAPRTLARWAELNGCAAASVAPLADAHDDGTRVRVERFGDCAGGTATTLFAIEGGGHTWPGSAATWPGELGPVSQEVSAAETIAALLLEPGP